MSAGSIAKRLNNDFTARQKKELDEYIEILWHLQEKHGSNLKKFLDDIQTDWDPSISHVLKEKGLIKETKTEIKLTEKGNEHARKIVRSHRLAERLLTDVLNLELDHAETGACEFEHIVVPEIVDGICTLLGHPKVCPHGLAIPEGKCCREARKSVQSFIKNLNELKSGNSAKIAYINTQSNSRMHQLTQLGIQPGIEISVHQTYPTLVIKIGTSQIALDEKVASEILVWE